MNWKQETIVVVRLKESWVKNWSEDVYYSQECFLEVFDQGQKVQKLEGTF